MENKEFAFQGKTINGILMLVINLLVFLTGIGMFVLTCLSEETWQACVCGISSAVLLILSIICVCGFILVEPGQARVLLFFGKYRGTFTQPELLLAESVYQSEKTLASSAQPRCRTHQGERQDGQPHHDRHGIGMETERHL